MEGIVKINIFIKYLYFILLIRFVSSNLGKNFTKFIINDNFLRDLETDNYIIIYFNQSCNYLSGFENQYRNNISFIINEEEKDYKYTSKEELFVKK